MVVHKRADVVVRASLSRREAVKLAESGVAFDGIVNPFVLAEKRREEMIAKEVHLATETLGREVRAQVRGRQRDAITSSAFVSVSALVAFEVVGPEGLWWRPDDVRPAPKLVDEDAP